MSHDNHAASKVRWTGRLGLLVHEAMSKGHIKCNLSTNFQMMSMAWLELKPIPYSLRQYISYNKLYNKVLSLLHGIFKTSCLVMSTIPLVPLENNHLHSMHGICHFENV